MIVLAFVGLVALAGIAETHLRRTRPTTTHMQRRNRRHPN